MRNWLISALVILSWSCAPLLPMPLRTAALAAGLAWWLYLIGRSGNNPARLGKIVLAAVGIRLAAALALYTISAWHLPLLRALQHEEPGFWNFAMDAVATHRYALAVLSAWTRGTELPVFTSAAIEYHLIVAEIYRWFGPFPLNGILINVALSALQAVLAVWTVRKFASETQALRAGWLVALWPSAVIWSAQLMKDALCGVLVFGVIAAAVSLWDRAKRGASAASFWWVTLAISIAGITKMRSYMGIALALSLLGVFVPVSLRAAFGKRFAVAANTFGVAAVAAFSMIAAYQCPYPQRAFFITYYEPGAPPAPFIVEEDWIDIHAEAPVRVEIQKPGDVRIEMLSPGAPVPSLPEGTYQIILVAPTRTVAEKVKRWSNLYDEPEKKTPSLAEQLSDMWPAKDIKQQVRTAKKLLARQMEPEARPKVRIQFDRPGRVLVENARELLIEARDPQGNLIQARHQGPMRLTAISPAQGIAVYPTDWFAGRKQAQAPTATAAAVPSPGPAAYKRVSDGSKPWWSFMGDLWPAKPVRDAIHVMLDHTNAVTVAFIDQASITRVMSVRRGILSERGRTDLFSQTSITNSSELIRFLPKGLFVAWFAPFPNQWFDTSGSSGAFRILGGIEMLLFYLMLPWILRGAWTIFRRKEADGLTILLFIALCSVVLGLFIPNAGTLFRLRQPMILLCLLIAAVGFREHEGSAKA